MVTYSRPWSTLAQVMACCLEAPSHYLNQVFGILKVQLTHCDLILPHSNRRYTWVNTDSSNGMLPSGTKPLPEPILTEHQWGSVAFSWEAISYELFKIEIHEEIYEVSSKNYTFKITATHTDYEWCQAITCTNEFTDTHIIRAFIHQAVKYLTIIFTEIWDPQD